MLFKVLIFDILVEIEDDYEDVLDPSGEKEGGTEQKIVILETSEQPSQHVNVKVIR